MGPRRNPRPTSSELEAFTQAIPSRRIGDPEDIAGAAVFLASDLSRDVNGESLVIDGGDTHTE
ncbi:SDR family oxidoreductase (plasmid) [Natrinema pallidum]|uniref:SDR family oxidoreductase n=1 Tax=Natrinema pallidum TaxID=69527 RepID=A0A4V1IFJ5_9EURY|nr:SDR family oxidoreductase [Natrinema pallidum]